MYPRIRVSTLQYTKKFTWGGVVFSTAYPRIHFTTYYLEVYLGMGATFDCVSAYPAFSEVQLQNGGVFCSYSLDFLHARIIHDGTSIKSFGESYLVQFSVNYKTPFFDVSATLDNFVKHVTKLKHLGRFKR